MQDMASLNMKQIHTRNKSMIQFEVKYFKWFKHLITCKLEGTDH